MLAEPVVGYSITYPVGVVGMILTIALMQRIWKIDYAAEAAKMLCATGRDQRADPQPHRARHPSGVIRRNDPRD